MGHFDQTCFASVLIMNYHISLDSKNSSCLEFYFQRPNFFGYKSLTFSHYFVTLIGSRWVGNSMRVISSRSKQSVIDFYLVYFVSEVQSVSFQKKFCLGLDAVFLSQSEATNVYSQMHFLLDNLYLSLMAPQIQCSTLSCVVLIFYFSKSELEDLLLLSNHHWYVSQNY